MEWWKTGNQVSNNFDRMLELIDNEALQIMYKHGFMFSLLECNAYAEAIETNLKLFKHCYEKTYRFKRNFKTLLDLAFEIEKLINYNNAVIFIDIVADSNVDFNLNKYYAYNDFETFVTAVTKYSLNFTRFIEYICYDLYRQGVQEFNHDRLTDYVDYLDMQVGLYGEIKEKYPRYLATEHDVIALKYNTYKKHNEDLIMLNIAENQKDLIYKKGDYVIILPESTSDIIDEGIQQSHCVASYADRVLNNKTLIVFMRHKDELDKSLVTIEVKDNIIVQARRYANKPPLKQEELFIGQWAKEKKLKYKKEGN